MWLAFSACSHAGLERWHNKDRFDSLGTIAVGLEGSGGTFPPVGITRCPHGPMKRLRVLASAFACAPGGASEQFGGGELILGWNVVQQLARFHDVWVLTHSQNRGAIEKGVQEKGQHCLRFCCLRLPGLLEHLKSVQGGIQFYAYLGQLRAYFVVRKLHRQVGFDVFHHVTYANDWMASFIGALLPVPYVRGPGGGGWKSSPWIRCPRLQAQPVIRYRRWRSLIHVYDL
jgi:hypothetical protein